MAPTPPPEQHHFADFMASIVVFLVALPLCIGLAMASGVPVERGLITGIVGGIVVGCFTGSPLLVSGPAASLLVLVWDLVHTHGLEMLGPVVVGAGLVQMGAGLLGLGQWFRAVSPAVIRGMMSGIGVLIVASQLHVVLDGTPGSSLVANLSTFPGAVSSALSEGRPALWVGLVTVAILVAWKRFRPARMSLVPPQVVAVVAVVVGCQAFGLEVLYLDISGGLFGGVDLVGPSDLWAVAGRGLIPQCLVFAFVASAATLLTATAIDQVQSEVQTDYDRELFAQGIGNTVAGGLGGLPMTGVIVRSSANVEAGARTKLSTILHGIWLLVFVALFPGALALIPKATLGAILVVVGLNLAHPDGMKKLDERDRTELLVGLVTLGGVVGMDLFSGILLGLGASVLRLVYAFTRFEIGVEPGKDDRYDVYLSGFATFLQLPKLAVGLESIPAGAHVTVHLDTLDYADHAAFEQLAAAERRIRRGGGSLEVEWDELLRRYKEGPTPGADTQATRGLLGSLRRRLRVAVQVLGRQAPPGAQESVRLEITPERVFLDLTGDELVPILETVLDGEMASPERLQDAARRAIALGDGVLLVHSSLPTIDEARLSVARLTEPLHLAGGRGDLLFVLVDGDDDPEGHLLALGDLARVCSSPERLEAIRQASAPDEVVQEVEAGIFEAEDPRPTAPAPGSDLVVLELVPGGSHDQWLEESLRRVFGEVGILGPDDATARLLVGAAGLPTKGDLLLVDVPPSQSDSLATLVEEFARTTGAEAPPIHRLRVVPEPSEVSRKVVGR